VEVEHQFHSGFLHFFGDSGNVVDILIHSLVFRLLCGVFGVYKESHPDGVPPLFGEECHQVVDFRACGVEEFHSRLLVGGQQRHVASHGSEGLRLFLTCAAAEPCAAGSRQYRRRNDCRQSFHFVVLYFQNLRCKDNKKFGTSAEKS